MQIHQIISCKKKCALSFFAKSVKSHNSQVWLQITGIINEMKNFVNQFTSRKQNVTIYFLKKSTNNVWRFGVGPDLHSYSGSCYCGNVGFEYFTKTKRQEWQIRECQCTFCRKHASKNVADPNGYLNVFVKNKKELSKFQFGLKTSWFWICRNCGVYTHATTNDDKFATINVNALPQLKEKSETNGPTKQSVPVVYDSENEEERFNTSSKRVKSINQFVKEQLKTSKTKDGN
ncbi:hypothetical protein RFI_23946 [Reticulomyxa filosa]|uniref:CENP-V/GFA domain-containing protein n=1 Tax=Reticulomyxa filosa TaxID=46433 RepID=X6MJ36_RETFI|nr:hypothetical protein RFI_23946 [Reticulomyxa filosa]|eukprot:ETO13432.1 hypothetical protein RFI_23946 [Reticulomyxa filosa]